MATVAPSPALAAQARRVYVELLQRELPTLVREFTTSADRTIRDYAAHIWQVQPQA